MSKEDQPSAEGYGQGWKVRTVSSGANLNDEFYPQPTIPKAPPEGRNTGEALDGFFRAQK